MMDLVAAALVLTAIGGGATARWTRLHPIVVGLLVGFPGGVLAFLVAAGVMSPAAIGFGFVVWLICAAVASFGAFIGWLRRDYLKRRS